MNTSSQKSSVEELAKEIKETSMIHEEIYEEFSVKNVESEEISMPENENDVE